MAPTTLLGRDRNPFAVWFLSVITLGIYFYYWYYQINREIRLHDPRVKSSPGVSLLAVSPLTVFTLCLSALVSMYNTAVRIQQMEMADGVPNPISPLVTVILLFFFGIGYYFQIQSHLNAHWYRHRLAWPEYVPPAEQQGALAPPTPQMTMPEAPAPEARAID